MTILQLSEGELDAVCDIKDACAALWRGEIDTDKFVSIVGDAVSYFGVELVPLPVDPPNSMEPDECDLEPRLLPRGWRG